MNRAEVCEAVREVGIVPVVRASSAALARRAVDALIAGGVPVCEITMTVPDAVALIAELSKSVGERVLVGAGTVLDARQAAACIDAGARFVVSPGFDEGTVRECQKREVAVMPGALTPTEVIRAWRAGASMVKVFPCSALGGASYLKALKGPLPDVKLLPTGGVNLDTAESFLRAGAVALGVGSDLVSEVALKEGKDEEIERRARAFREIVLRFRGELA
jgi:2-dehydro-3-deoxyphosphogluconate aldolase/(4S)-4-hydroxy-2-oxoglutarate aldolase